jgi:quinoprotein glucose dehydrogenase
MIASFGLDEIGYICLNSWFMSKFILPFCAVLALITYSQCTSSGHADWPEYLGNAARDHYSPLDQINTGNVKNLKPAWEFHTHDTSGQIQCNPIIVDGIMYATTASVQVFALDAATGTEIWRFTNAKEKAWYNTNRGVVYWADGDDKRILFSTGPWLYALNAKTGNPIPSFGMNGRIDLHEGLGEGTANKFVVATTPGTVFHDLLIMGSRVSEESDAAPGHVRAFNIRTGKLEWIFHTIPQKGEPGYETWPNDPGLNRGGANCWAGMALDPARGILFVPTGSAAFDFYGGNRPGQNLYANCLLALDAATGTLKWHFQFVHHDIWDRDLPAPPVLMTLHSGSKPVDVVVQTTKYGYVYVFNRETGEPAFPIVETPVPGSTLAGEQAWPTQPLPSAPAPYARQTFGPEDINPYTIHKDTLLKRLAKVRKDHLFAPPSEDGTLIFPGFDGGAEWGGAAADPDGVLYVNANNMPWILTMVPKKTGKPAIGNLSSGAKVYQTRCGTCHGPDRKGIAGSNAPALTGLKMRSNRIYVEAVISAGKGMMPGYSTLSQEERKSVVDFILEEKETGGAMQEKDDGIPYTFTGYNRFVDAEGYPAVSPPWGTLNAIDLNTGQYKWSVPLGEIKALMDKGIPPTGTENYGGPVVTAGGVLFIGATKDGQFRAFDIRTGKKCWQYNLPAAAFATPSTYMINGKQYVVIACGGSKLGTKKGDSYLAFTL